MRNMIASESYWLPAPFGVAGTEPKTRTRMPNFVLVAAFLLWAVPAPLSALADCPPLRDSLTDQSVVLGNGGTINGPVSFVPAINDSGASFSGNASIRYESDLFRSSSGSVSLWFKKNSADDFGGIMQVGHLGELNSMGLFYVNGTDLRFEIRNASSTLAVIAAVDVLSQTEYTHIFAVWEDRGSAVVTKLFVNGRYIDYRWIDGDFYHVTNNLDIGVSGVGSWYGFAEGVIDELCYFDHAVLDSEVYAEYVYSSNRFLKQATGKPISTGPVRLQNGTLWVEGRPFTVKGVGYQPMPIGSEISRTALDLLYTDPCILERDIPLLRAMNVNTVRTWSQLPDSNAFLDALYNDGVDPIYVIMGFWVPLYSGYDYGDPANILQLQNDFAAYANRFKDHPAVLAWGIGNENNLAYEGPLHEWYYLANKLAETAYVQEGAAYHPTLIVNGGLADLGDVDQGSDDASLDFVDIWGHNTYLGYSDQCYFDYYDLLSAKPTIVTEYGIDAFDMATGTEYQQVQADWVAHQWRTLSRRTLGGTVMAYSDEWWKAGDSSSQDDGGYFTDQHPDGFSNEEWWGMVSVEQRTGTCDEVHPRLVFAALSEEFAAPTIPTLSEWGVGVMMLLFLAGGTLLISKRRSILLHGPTDATSAVE